ASSAGETWPLRQAARVEYGSASTRRSPMTSLPRQTPASWRWAGGRCRDGYESTRSTFARSASSPDGSSSARRTPARYRRSDSDGRPVCYRADPRRGRLRSRTRPGSIGRVTTPQGGIFALGTASHAYLEFDGAAGRGERDLVTAISSLREPRTTMGGVNLVAGFRPELWRDAAPDDAPGALEGLNEDLVGVDGFVMPATQHDAVLWLSGSAYDVIFGGARTVIGELRGLGGVGEETSSWAYRHDLDLTGFIDGTENPTLIDAPELVLIPDGKPGAGGTILLLQKWVHDAAAWESLPVESQERV